MAQTARPGWVVVGEEFLRRRRLTNIELGNIPGVQAFRSRIADLRKRGWPISDGAYMRKGVYIYEIPTGWQPPVDWRGPRPDAPAPAAVAIVEECAAEADEGLALFGDHVGHAPPISPYDEAAGF